MKNIATYMILFMFATLQISCNSCSIVSGKSGGKSSICTEQITIKNCFEPIKEDGFTVVYRKLENGYDVKAVLSLNSDGVFEILQADIHFSKGNDSYVLHSKCFGDTTFSKGMLDYKDENISLLKKYKSKSVITDYKDKSEANETMPQHVPFFFRDLDFDGIDELVIVNYSCGIRYHITYDVYRIVEGRPFRISYPPYCNETYKEEGMTEYPKFDFVNKTVTCNYPEGELRYVGCKTYVISKKKDLIKINDRKHYFNQQSHFEKRQKILK